MSISRTEEKRIYSAVLYHRRRDNGLCVECGLMAVPGMARCDYHLEVDQERRIARKAKREAKAEAA